MEITALLQTISTKTLGGNWRQRILEGTSLRTNFQTWRGTMCDYKYCYTKTDVLQIRECYYCRITKLRSSYRVLPEGESCMDSHLATIAWSAVLINATPQYRTVPYRTICAVWSAPRKRANHRAACTGDAAQVSGPERGNVSAIANQKSSVVGIRSPCVDARSVNHQPPSNNKEE